MRYQFDHAITLPDGLPMHTSDTDKSPFTAQKAFVIGLLSDTPENQSSKLERYDLFLKVRSGSTEYSTREATLLRDAALSFQTLVAGQLVAILDQK